MLPAWGDEERSPARPHAPPQPQLSPTTSGAEQDVNTCLLTGERCGGTAALLATKQGSQAVHKLKLEVLKLTRFGIQRQKGTCEVSDNEKN